ncbi:MAG: prolyl oligopeptidase family serine peptidase, partial [Congregibacter sp.]
MAIYATVVAESPNTLQAAALFGDHLLLTYLVDASNRVLVYDLPAAGSVAEDGAGPEGRMLTLPALGSVAGLSGRQGDDAFYLTFTSFAHPATIYRSSLTDLGLEPFFTPTLPIEPSDYEVEQVFMRGDDGTRIPMFLVHKAGITLDGSHPTYLYGYGGFNISITPAFSAANLAWVEQGGIFAQAVLRGGGEYGEEWHQAGMLEKKQNVFDDFIACARYLVRNGYTSKDKLAIGGRSNGGLLAAACLVQEPDMFGAAIPEVGVLDMLRYHKFTIG